MSPEAPPAPPVGAPPSTVSPTPNEASGQPQFADFDTSFPDGLDSPEPALPAKETVTADKPKSDSQTAGTTAPKPDKPEPAKTTADKPVEDDAVAESEGDEYQPPQVAKPSELRGWALRMGKKAKQANEQLAALQLRLKTLESQPPRQAEATGNLAAELAEAKKRLDQYENDLRLTKYEKSNEYAEKYQKPYAGAVSRAYREVKELLVSEPKPGGELDEKGQPTEFMERPGTQSDFDEIYNLPLGQASRLAKAKFGDAATIVMQHRQKIRELAESAFAAVEEYKGKAQQVETETKAQQAQREQGMLKMFNFAAEAHAKKNESMFMPRDGDSEGNELLAKGRAFGEAVFSGNDGLSPQQIAMRDARALNWLTAYPRLARDVKKLQVELSEANKTIQDMRGSSPGKPKPSAEAPPTSAGGILDDFDKALPG